MRRIALTAALVATLAGGAAALAATPDPGAPDAAPPDPYQGAWTLAIDGRYAGRVAQVQGCGLAARVVTDELGHGKHLASPAPEECTFQAGGGMTPDFYNLVNDGLAGIGKTHQVELVRTDLVERYGLLVEHAMLSSIAMPQISRASTSPFSLEVGISGDRITRDPAPKYVGNPPFGRTRIFDPAQLKVTVAGEDIGASAAGPWQAEIRMSPDHGDVRGLDPTQPEPSIGNLPLRVPEAGKAMTRILDPWVQNALVTGAANAAQPVSVAVGGFSLTFDRAAPQRADLVPRADGARTYSLYADHAVLAGE